MLEFLKIFGFVVSIFLGLFLIGELCGLISYLLGPVFGILALLIIIAFLISLLIYIVDKDVRA